MKINGLSMLKGSLKGLRVPSRANAANTGRDNRLVLGEEGTDMSLVVVTPVVPSQTIDVSLSQNMTAGYYHASVIDSTGGIQSWGRDLHGQVSQTPSGSFLAVAGGGHHGAAIADDRSIVSWGYDAYNAVSDTPAGNDYVQIACGGHFSLALRSNGAIEAWGYNDKGQVADCPEGTGYIAIAAGGSFGLALREDGTLSAWGDNAHSQRSNTPTDAGYVFIAAGVSTAGAIRSDGSLVLWGRNDYNMVSNAPSGNNFVSLCIGRQFACALRDDGSIVSWGNDSYNQLTTSPKGSHYTQISVSDAFGLAMSERGGVVIWGLDQYGLYDVPALVEAPISIPSIGLDAEYATSARNLSEFAKSVDGTPYFDNPANVTIEASNVHDTSTRALKFNADTSLYFPIADSSLFDKEFYIKVVCFVPTDDVALFVYFSQISGVYNDRLLIGNGAVYEQNFNVWNNGQSPAIWNPTSLEGAWREIIFHYDGASKFKAFLDGTQLYDETFTIGDYTQREAAIRVLLGAGALLDSYEIQIEGVNWQNPQLPQ